MTDSEHYGGPDPVYCQTQGCPRYGQPCSNPSGVPVDGSGGFPPMTCGGCDQPVTGDQPPPF